MATFNRWHAGWPDQPVVLEINTWVWLDDVSSVLGRRVDLGSVPPGAWDDVLLPGVDAVWLMGVWARSPAGSVIARTDPGVRAELELALPDLTEEDIVGSPYAVRSYSVDSRLGGDAGLASARETLAQRGVGLLLDYVPNHVARDHAWATSRPEYLVRGSAEDLAARPGEFVQIGDTTVALGRDPYFPAWSDVVQLNAFAPALRAATTQTLQAIAQRADGVRCDMAMLLLNDIFAATWGALVGPAPDEEFWPAVIGAVRETNPGFLFVAEAYWDTEPQLLSQGFDYCYDKRLYDHVVGADADGLRRHLAADVSYQRRMVRFLENHDEPRAAAALRDPQLRTAAVAVATLPGALLVYEGQAVGRLHRPPVQLGRRPLHEPDAQLRGFYDGLFGWLAESRVRTGAWELLPVDAVGHKGVCGGLVGWGWTLADLRCVVVVNFATQRMEGRVRLPWPDLGEGQMVAVEVLGDARYHHDAAEVRREGLYVNLEAGRFHILAV